jgi:putative oxidoreductase
MTTATAMPATPVRPTKPRKWGAVDLGLLILRVGFGVLFILHGWLKIVAGPDMWAKVGSAIGLLGVPLGGGQWGFLSDPRVWGCAAAIIEFGGGTMLVLGLFVRPFAFLMLCNMIVAMSFHIHQFLSATPPVPLLDANAYVLWSHPAKAAVAFLALLIAGGGRYALGQAIPPFRRRWFA